MGVLYVLRFLFDNIFIMHYLNCIYQSKCCFKIKMIYNCWNSLVLVLFYMWGGIRCHSCLDEYWCESYVFGEKDMRLFCYILFKYLLEKVFHTLARFQTKKFCSKLYLINFGHRFLNFLKIPFVGIFLFIAPCKIILSKFFYFSLVIKVFIFL